MRAWRAGVAAVVFWATACVQLLDLPEELSYVTDAAPDVAVDVANAETSVPDADAGPSTLPRVPFPTDCATVPSNVVCIQQWQPVLDEALAALDAGAPDADADAGTGVDADTDADAPPDANDGGILLDDTWALDPDTACTVSAIADPSSDSVLDFTWSGTVTNGLLCSIDRAITNVTQATGMRVRLRIFLENLPAVGDGLVDLGYDRGTILGIDWEADRFRILVGDETIRRELVTNWNDFELHVVPGFRRADIYLNGELLASGIDVSFADLSTLYVSLGLYSYVDDVSSASPVRVRYDDLVIMPF